jgi:hypothetical protein
MGGPSNVEFPEPTEEERALQSEQLSLLRSQKDILSRQLREQNLLLPFLYGGLGLKPKFNDAGAIVSFDQDEQYKADTEQQQRIVRMMAQRSEQALGGSCRSAVASPATWRPSSGSWRVPWRPSWVPVS